MSRTRRPDGGGHGRRESRAVREARRRREAFRRRLMLLAAGMIGIVIVALVAIVLLTRPSDRAKPRAGSPRVAGIPCQAEQGPYHEHVHLSLVRAGTAVRLPRTIGQGPSGCLYWVHMHTGDPAGIIHIEAPRRIVPTLGQLFAVWGQPLSRRQVWRFRVPRGQALHVYVNRRPYPGDPRLIALRPYTAISLQIGSPFGRPRRYVFGAGY